MAHAIVVWAIKVGRISFSVYSWKVSQSPYSSPERRELSGQKDGKSRAAHRPVTVLLVPDLPKDSLALAIGKEVDQQNGLPIELPQAFRFSRAPLQAKRC